jgi:hypothetical protein
MNDSKAPSSCPSCVTTRWNVRTEADLLKLERLVTNVITYRYFKATRTSEGRAQYFFGNEIIKGRGGRKCAKEREPRVKAHTAIWFLTDGLEEKGRLIIERNVNRDAD